MKSNEISHESENWRRKNWKISYQIPLSNLWSTLQKFSAWHLLNLVNESRPLPFVVSRHLSLSTTVNARDCLEDKLWFSESTFFFNEYERPTLTLSNVKQSERTWSNRMTRNKSRQQFVSLAAGNFASHEKKRRNQFYWKLNSVVLFITRAL